MFEPAAWQGMYGRAPYRANPTSDREGTEPMHVSEARVAANRLNALKSCGPKTPEGKEISRRNAFKHGLAGEGVVVSDADRQEIERRAEALASELAPRSPSGAMMVRKMATLSVRSERAAERELAAVAVKVRSAVEDFDQARLDQADAHFAALGDDPRANLRRLKKTPEGVDRLLDAWDDLRDDLAVGDWDEPQCHLVAHLMGVRASVGRLRAIGALALAITGDFSALNPTDGAGLDDEARRGWAKAKLVEQIDAQVAELKAHRETLDFEAIELDRLDAPALALFDTSKEATLARRYEAAADRGFFRALRELRRAEAEFAAKAEAAASSPPPPYPASDPRMGSIGDPGGPGGSEPLMREPLRRTTPYQPPRAPEVVPVVVGRPPVNATSGG
jgi:hypothetical protein